MTSKGIMLNFSTKPGHITLEMLDKMDTIHQGHFSNIKADFIHEDKVRYRVSLSRMLVADGEPFPNRVIIQRKAINSEWEVVSTYQAK